MRVILEKAEIVAILSKHFESDFDPSKVVIRTDPELEIELRDIPLTTDSSSKSPPPPREKDVREIIQEDNTRSLSMTVDEEAVKLFKTRAHGTNASIDPPPPGADGVEEGSASESLHAFAMASEQLQAELSQKHPNVYNSEPRRIGGNANPPTDFTEEIS